MVYVKHVLHPRLLSSGVCSGKNSGEVVGCLLDGEAVVLASRVFE